jgi:hypothetical protein
VSTLLVLLLSLTLGINASQAVTKKAPTLQGASYQLLKDQLTKYQTSKFSKVTSLGNLETYRLALSSITVVVNTKMKAQALYDPVKNILMISQDPRKIISLPPKSRAGWADTVWHEVTHRIEDQHGDIGVFDSKLYAERNVDYMTHIANAMYILQRLEQKANAGTSQAELKKLWDLFVREHGAASKLESTKKYPPNVKTLQTWTGFKVNIAEIKKFYAAGGGGKALQKLFAPTPSTTTTTKKPQPPSIGTRLNGTWDMNANGYTFWMKLQVSGSQISGTMARKDNSEPVDQVVGTFTAYGNVNFTRTRAGEWKQVYTGTLTKTSSGKEQLSGSFDGSGWWKATK